MKKIILLCVFHNFITCFAQTQPWEILLGQNLTNRKTEIGSGYREDAFPTQTSHGIGGKSYDLTVTPNQIQPVVARFTDGIGVTGQPGYVPSTISYNEVIYLTDPSTGANLTGWVNSVCEVKSCNCGDMFAVGQVYNGTDWDILMMIISSSGTVTYCKRIDYGKGQDDFANSVCDFSINAAGPGVFGTDLGITGYTVLNSSGATDLIMIQFDILTNSIRCAMQIDFPLSTTSSYSEKGNCIFLKTNPTVCVGAIVGSCVNPGTSQVSAFLLQILPGTSPIWVISNLIIITPIAGTSDLVFNGVDMSTSHSTFSWLIAGELTDNNSNPSKLGIVASVPWGSYTYNYVNSFKPSYFFGSSYSTNGYLTYNDVKCYGENMIVIGQATSVNSFSVIEVRPMKQDSGYAISYPKYLGQWCAYNTLQGRFNGRSLSLDTGTVAGPSDRPVEIYGHGTTTCSNLNPDLYYLKTNLNIENSCQTNCQYFNDANSVNVSASFPLPTYPCQTVKEIQITTSALSLVSSENCVSTINLPLGMSNDFSCDFSLVGIRAVNGKYSHFIASPSPFTDYLSVRIINENTKVVIQKIEILDFTGRVILTRKVSDEISVKLSLSDLSVGIYFVHVTDNTGTQIRTKVEKQ